MQAVVAVVGAGIGFAVTGGNPAGAKWGFMIGGMVGSWLYPPRTLAGPNQLAGMGVSAPQKGTPLPVLYGRNRVPGQIIWYGNLTTWGAGGGSGGGGKYPQGTMTVGMAIALGEGEITHLWQAYQNGSPITLASYSWYTGTMTQAADSYMGAHLETIGDPSQPNPSPPPDYLAYITQVACAYPGVAYLVLQEFNLGNSSAIPSLTFEIGRTNADLCAGNAALATLGMDGYTESASGDLNPAVCLLDFLTHPRYGLGIPTAMIHAASWKDTADWVLANGLYSSPYIDGYDDGMRHIEHLLTYFDGILVHSQGLFKLTARRSPAQETLPYAPVDWRDWMEHPRFSKPVDRQVPNAVGLEFLNRHNFYSKALLERRDDWNAGQRGLYRDQISLVGVTEPLVADKLVAKLLWARVIAPFTVELSLGPTAAWFEPGDIISVVGSAHYALEDVLLRLVNIREEKDGSFVATAVEAR